jgi:YbgC/YbaW family acyl-CoA thioester hydrolase
MNPTPVSVFVYRRRVQFPETDATGIVHFTNFFKYVEEAEHAMWRSVGLSIAHRDASIGWPRVAASFEYRKPLRFEEEFDVHLRVAEKTKKTIRYEAELRRDDEVVAIGSLTVICVRRTPGEPMRATDIPPEVDAMFAVAAPGAGGIDDFKAPVQSPSQRQVQLG